MSLQFKPNTSAPTYLTDAAAVMEERAKEYDQPGGERSMGKTVEIFNLYTGKSLVESEGWLFMQILKDVRQWSNPGFHQDSAKDCIAYAALKAESLEKEASSGKKSKDLEAEISDLLTVMVAAAEEIDEHWSAHCDQDGYGPVNLMRRLEQGIASKYAYTAGDFNRLCSRVEELESENTKLKASLNNALDSAEAWREYANGR